MLYFCILVVLLLIIWFKIKYNYWKNKGVIGPKPMVLLGNLAETFLLRRPPIEIYSKIYLKYSSEPFVGAYRGLTPVLIVRDIDLVKDVLIKDFHYFHDNNIKIDKNIHPILFKNPFLLRGDRWKIVRNQITPSLTTGKLKPYHTIITENAKELVELLKKDSASFSDVKMLCGKYMLNTVFAFGMGINGNAFKDTQSDIKQILHDIFTPTYMNIIRPLIGFTFPSLSILLKLGIFPQTLEKKLLQLIEEILKYREENNIIRNDYLDKMKYYKKSCTQYEFTNSDITANVLTLILDGYETTTTVMSCVLHSLATHPVIQQKLRDEIMQTDDDISFEQLQELPYLDAVIYETIRMYPPAVVMTRECTKQYVLEKNDRKVVVDVGTPIIIPTYGFHKDPKYFPDPDIFNPKRFLGGNRDKIPKGAFHPFGEGRRICIGRKFGMMQVKTGVYHIIKNFNLISEKNLEVKFHPLSFILAPAEPLMIKFTEIK